MKEDRIEWDSDKGKYVKKYAMWDSKKEEFYIKDTYTKSFNKKPIKTLKQVLNVVNKTKKLNRCWFFIGDKRNNITCRYSCIGDDIINCIHKYRELVLHILERGNK